jgi:hypothetical protein
MQGQGLLFATDINSLANTELSVYVMDREDLFAGSHLIKQLEHEIFFRHQDA